MKLREAIRLGHANIATQKRRSAMMIIVIGVIFSVVFAGNMMLQGLESRALEAMMQPTEGKIYLRVDGVRYTKDSGDSVESESARVSEAEVRESFKGYHGESLGRLGAAGGYVVLPREVAGKFVEVDLGTVPDGAVPLLASVSQASYLAQISLPTRGKAANKIRALEKIREETLGKNFTLMNDYYVVGVMPGGGVRDLSLKNVGDKSNPLDVILGQFSVDNAMSYAVELVTDVAEEIGADAVGEAGVGVVDGAAGAVDSAVDEPTTLPYLLEFTSTKQALAYSEAKGVCYAQYHSCAEGDLVVDDVFGGVLDVLSRARILQLVLLIISGVLAVIGLIVMYFTVMRLIGQDGQTISLYYALGATRRDVGKIYLCYVLELALWAVGFAVVLGAGMMVALSLINAEGLTAVWQLAYGVQGWRVWLIGWNSWMWLLIGIMLAMALLCYLGNYWQFSGKRLGRRLKG